MTLLHQPLPIFIVNDIPITSILFSVLILVIGIKQTMERGTSPKFLLNLHIRVFLRLERLIDAGEGRLGHDNVTWAVYACSWHSTDVFKDIGCGKSSWNIHCGGVSTYQAHFSCPGLHSLTFLDQLQPLALIFVFSRLLIFSNLFLSANQAVKRTFSLIDLGCFLPILLHGFSQQVVADDMIKVRPIPIYFHHDGSLIQSHRVVHIFIIAFRISLGLASLLIWLLSNDRQSLVTNANFALIASNFGRFTRCFIWLFLCPLRVIDAARRKYDLLKHA